jgi:ribose 5-phosphate isomerase B
MQVTDHDRPIRWALGYDHAGFRLAAHVRRFLVARGHTVRSFGPPADAPAVDYPPFCIAAARTVVDGNADFGIVIGGSGQGEQIAANKVAGIRAALCPQPHFAELARLHNDANVLALPGRVVAPEHAERIILSWIGTAFSAGRHVGRLALIDQYERGELHIDPAEWELNDPR